MYDGKRYHHILDPRTGYPAKGSISVTVIHHDAGIADAAATALFVAGPEHWYEIARAMDIKYAIRILTRFQLSRALVTKKGSMVGIVTLRDMTIRYPDRSRSAAAEESD